MFRINIKYNNMNVYGIINALIVKATFFLFRRLT